MRIVYALTSLGMGGAEKLALAVADRMAARGHDVALLVLRPPLDNQWPTALRVVHLAMRKTPLSVLSGLIRARSFLREFRPDLLHSHSFHANVVARLLKLLVPSVRVVCTVHNVYEGRWPRMLAYRLTDALACCTTAVSQSATDRFVRLKSVSRKKCIVLLNGIDTVGFTPSAERRVLTRQAMGTEEQFIWLAAGRMVAAKDYPNLLRAFRVVRRNFPQARLWIAGEPVDAMRKRTENGRPVTVSGFAVERGSMESSSMENVRLLGLRRDLPALMDAADAFVQASAWEGMPLAVGEAMAMEKPVVATDAGGTRELLGNAGIVVPTQAPEALAAAMLELMRLPPGRRGELGFAGRERIAQHFSMEAAADAWEALYRRCLHP